MKNLLIIFSVMLIFASSCRQSGSNQTKTSFSEKDYDNVILVYNFYSTYRCPSCVAIEEATKKTLDTYFSKELKEGKIKQVSLNVDESENKQIAEKYEAYGSGLRITRIKNGKEQTIDLTAEGFKYASAKEEKFIEILKSKIDEFLK